MNQTLRRIAPVMILVLLLLVALVLLSNATQDSARFSEIYSILLIVSAIGLTFLAGLIVWNVWRLLAQVRRRDAGARLTLRMVAIFVLLSLTPVLVVYYFSLQVLHRGIDSWFDVQVETALTDALELGRTSLGVRMREQLKQSEAIASAIDSAGLDGLTLTLSSSLATSGASQLTVLDAGGAILASSSLDASRLVPYQADSSVLLQVTNSRSYVGIDPVGDAGLHVLVVVNLPLLGATGQRTFLQALYPVAERMNELAQTVQAAYAKYRELAYLREPLKFSFTLTLSLVLLLSIFAAVWSAFVSARRMVAPLQSLAVGTQAVAAGDFSTRLGESASDDELGFLVKSFNAMTARLQTAQDETRHSQAVVEEQRTYLEAVLARMSSGVITVDNDHRVVTANTSACRILGLEAERVEGESLTNLSTSEPRVEPLTDMLETHFRRSDGDWRAELNLFGPNGRQVLMCRGTMLPGTDERPAGHVVVFDDLSAMIQAERNAAWSEVARRLAHEIKNPLTPIQLSAERLRHKYLDSMDEQERATLDRMTRTIVNQVEAMKEMVNAFSAYARTPTMDPQPLDINNLVLDVATLYGPKAVSTELDDTSPIVEADADRLRQVLHNLIKNAVEAMPDADTPTPVKVMTRMVANGATSLLELKVSDEGPGIPQDLLSGLFEPYVTGKAKGTGLGLAIVKKIVEEHGGMVWAQNNNTEVDDAPGASIIIRLPTSGIDAQSEREEVSRTSAGGSA